VRRFIQQIIDLAHNEHTSCFIDAKIETVHILCSIEHGQPVWYFPLFTLRLLPG
jgi:hypothetical protein